VPTAIGRESPGREGRVRGGHLAATGGPGDDRPMESADASLIYREEVTGILGALADLVVEIRRIRELLEDGEEEAD
jgi:hypothetical protein